MLSKDPSSITMMSAIWAGELHLLHDLVSRGLLVVTGDHDQDSHEWPLCRIKKVSFLQPTRTQGQRQFPI